MRIGPGDAEAVESGWRRWQPVALLLAAFAVYAPSLGGGFIWDDYDWIVNGPVPRDPAGLLTAWLDFEAGRHPWYPLTLSSFWLDYRLFGLWAPGYRIVNLLLLVANGWLLARLLRRLALPGAGIAAALLVLHPLSVESTAWIVERKNLLSGVFFLGALEFYARAVALGPLLREAPPPEAPPDARRHLLLAFACFALSLFAKTAAAMLPAGMLLLWWARQRRLSLRGCAHLLPFFALAAFVSAITIVLERDSAGASVALGGSARAMLFGAVPWFYLRQFLWPVELCFFYPRWTVASWGAAGYLGLGATVAALVALWALRRRVGLGPLVTLLFAGLMFFPISGLFDVFFFEYAWVADHYAWYGSFAFCAAAGALLAGLPRAPWATGVILALLALLSFRQAAHYQDEETLWRATLVCNPDAWTASNNLGLLLADAGRGDEARALFLDALRANPQASRPYINLGKLALEAGDIEAASQHFAAALARAPRDAVTHNDFGVLLAQQQRLREAVAHFREALRLDPNMREAYDNLQRARGLAP